MQDNFKNEKLDLKNRRLLIVYVVMAVIIIFYVAVAQAGPRVPALFSGNS